MNQHIEYVVAWLNAKFGIELGRQEQEGQGLVEYALIIVLVSIASIVALTALGGKVSGVFTTITGSL